VSAVRWNPKGMRRSAGMQSKGTILKMNRSAKVGAKVGQGRVCTSETKAFSFTHRTKVIAGSTARKNSA
jgi:hypothetical protein